MVGGLYFDRLHSMLEPIILFENADLLVIDKPAGMLVHGMSKFLGLRRKSQIERGDAKSRIKNMSSVLSDSPESSLVDWLLKKYPEIKNVGDHNPQAGEFEQKTFDRPGIVHRLDRETSGVMVVAKNQEAFNFLKKLFQTREVKKTYLALVWGRVSEERGIIDKQISIKDGSIKRTVGKGKMPREAVTEYEVMGRYGVGVKALTLLKVFPKTGRTHQIRVHLNSIGHPVVGDKLYGKKKEVLGLTRHFLHANSLELPLPSGGRITVASDLPLELALVLEKAQRDPEGFE